MESELDYYTAEALLAWQIELGATEAVMDSPVNRYETPKEAPKPKAEMPVAPVAETVRPVKAEVNVAEEAKRAVSGAADLDGLKAAIGAFEHCELKRGARNLVLADGNPAARVMVIGEAPGREEDMSGKPFEGAEGRLLDKMFAAIGMGRDVPLSKDAIYLSYASPWRLPQNAALSSANVGVLRAFVERHVEIVAPDVIVVMGNVACEVVLGKRGVTRQRGEWREAFGKPVLPMFDPQRLLQTPQAKRDAWADLLSLKAKLEALA